MKAKGSSFFWPSFTDLMTSLFFIMLVLYILTYLKLVNQYQATEYELNKIREIQSALSKLDSNYFDFDKKNLRYKLKVDVKFPPNISTIHSLTPKSLIDLKSAGRSLYFFMNKITKENPDINYLLVIEGNTQRTMMDNGKWNYLYMPNVGYEFSYQRSLALFNYWKDSGFDFREFNNCEIMISGSGYFGRSRESDEDKNRRFTIQITPKIGEIIIK